MAKIWTTGPQFLACKLISLKYMYVLNFRHLGWIMTKRAAILWNRQFLRHLTYKTEQKYVKSKTCRIWCVSLPNTSSVKKIVKIGPTVYELELFLWLLHNTPYRQKYESNWKKRKKTGGHIGPRYNHKKFGWKSSCGYETCSANVRRRRMPRHCKSTPEVC